MNTDKQPLPDDGYRKAWQQAFNEADDTPPPRVWNAIERNLDADNRARVIPLWVYVRPWATGVAATVAFVLTGWWAWRAITPASTTTLVAHAVSVNQSKTPAPVSAAKSAGDVAVLRGEKERVPALTPAPVSPERPVQRTQLSRVMASSPVLTTDNQSMLSVAADRHTRQPVPIYKVMGRVAGSASGRPPIAAEPVAPALAAFGQTNVLKVTAFARYPSATDETNQSALTVGPLSGKVFSRHPLSIQRVVWFRNEEPVAETAGSQPSKPAGRERWASLSIMPSSFSPDVTANVQVQSITTNAYLSTLSTIGRGSTKVPGLYSESGKAITVQLSAGAQLNRRWSVETGVGYMQAQSTVVSPVQAQALNDPADHTLYTAVIRNAIQQASPAAVATNSVADKNYTYVQPSQYDTQTQGRTRNDYSFVQVPVQVGYQLRPRRKLGLAVLGGLLTNLFVHNAVGETLVVKPGDSVYRSLTLAGTAGARLRYRSSHQWSASVAGVYQQALQSGTQSDGSLETHPHTVGVSFGMDYHF